MKENRQKIQRLTLAAFFVAIEVIMGFTPVGYIPIGTLSITTMHLPVILAGILLGPQAGMTLGFVFGLTSFLRATFEPGITSFVFTPFVSVGNETGSFWSLVICFGPRILLGLFSSLCYQSLLKRGKNRTMAASAAAITGTIIHTLLVLCGIYLFFGPSYARVLQTSMKGLAMILAGVISTNMILEALLAGTVVPALVKALTPAAERMGVLYGRS